MPNAKSFSFPLLASGVLGLTGVGLGALGAHALKAILIERGMTQAWETAARYHIMHAVALLALAAWNQASATSGRRLLAWAAIAWTAGTVMFSGSLYGIALGGPRLLGPVTPLGGLALLLGWLLVVIAAFRAR